MSLVRRQGSTRQGRASYRVALPVLVGIARIGIRPISRTESKVRGPAPHKVDGTRLEAPSGAPSRPNDQTQAVAKARRPRLREVQREWAEDPVTRGGTKVRERNRMREESNPDDHMPNGTGREGGRRGTGYHSCRLGNGPID